MDGSDPVRFVTERDEIIGGERERERFRPYETPVQVTNTITFLRSHDPRGADVFVFEGNPSNRDGRSPDVFIRELAGDYASQRPVAWVLSANPDEAVQRAATAEHDTRHLERSLPSPNVYATSRRSFFKAEQQWSQGDWKRFGPFDIHDINVHGREQSIAVPTYVRLSTLEEAMEARGSLEFYFPHGPFGIESTITATLSNEPRTDRRRGERYTPRQIRRVHEPHLMHRDGYRFKTINLNAARDTITPYLHKTS